MKAYRIVDWKTQFEVTDKGKPATADTPFDQLRKSPLPYARKKGYGWLLSPEFRQLCKRAWLIGPLMELACLGLYDRLIDISRNQEREYRGWILDSKHRPVNALQFADLLGIADQQNIPDLFAVLCDPEVGMLELLNYPDGTPLDSPARVEEEGGLLDTLGESEVAFLNVTEAEYKEEEKFKRNAGPAIPPVGGSSSPAPALPDKVSGQVSEIPDSVSATVPTGQGQGRKREIAAAKQQFLLELTAMIHWRNQSDRTTLCDIADQLEHKKLFETELALFCEALVKARECCKVADRPLAMFVAAMKKSPFNYIPKGTAVIRGAKDKYQH